jgi:hypothetical protein
LGSLSGRSSSLGSMNSRSSEGAHQFPRNEGSLLAKHSFPGETHGVYRVGFWIYNRRNKHLEFVIETCRKQIYMWRPPLKGNCLKNGLEKFPLCIDWS